MATVNTFRLGDLVEQSISSMLRPAERPLQLEVAAGLNTNSDRLLTLSDGASVGVSSLLEHQDELMLVTAKSDDLVPVFTVSRGYAGSAVRSPLLSGATVRRDPPFARSEVGLWVRRSVLNLEAHLPRVDSFESLREPGRQRIVLPADTLDVVQVRHMNYLSFRTVDVGGWQFEDHLPAGVVATGKMLRLPAGIGDDDSLIVTVKRAYAWVGSGTEDDTIDLPVGADDLPVLYASAYGQMRREVSRAELDKIEEWNQDQAIRAGVNLRLTRELWAEYYRRLDEARRVHRVPVHRTFRKRARIW